MAQDSGSKTEWICRRKKHAAIAKLPWAENDLAISPVN